LTLLLQLTRRKHQDSGGVYNKVQENGYASDHDDSLELLIKTPGPALDENSRYQDGSAVEGGTRPSESKVDRVLYIAVVAGVNMKIN